jgi:hypothetical protein
MLVLIAYQPCTKTVKTDVDSICWTFWGPVHGVASLIAWAASPLQRVSRGQEASYGFGLLLVLFRSESASTEI